MSRPLSKKAARQAPWFASLFFAIFLLVGLVATYAMSGGVSDFIRSGSWVEIPCTVESSEVGSHSGKSGPTYSIDISYSYNFQDQTHHSKRYSFVTGASSGGYEGKEEVVKMFPPGSVKSCYVDPKNPSHSVLYRGWSGEMLFILFPIVFIAVGAGGIYFSLRPKPTGKIFLSDSRKISSGQPAASSFSSAPVFTGPLVLKPKTSALVKMCGAFVFALIWNGIISIFICHAVETWQQGHPDWFLTLFMVPFVLIGLSAIAMIFYFMLSMGNPTAKLALNPASVALGETLQLGWGFDGKTNRIQNLRLILEAREEATYRRGTRTYTDKNVFLHREIINLSDSRQIVQGIAELEIPKDLVPSFTSGNNRIIWTLTLQGTIPRWPDVEEEFEFTVLPVRRSL